MFFVVTLFTPRTHTKDLNNEIIYLRYNISKLFKEKSNLSSLFGETKRWLIEVIRFKRFAWHSYGIIAKMKLRKYEVYVYYVYLKKTSKYSSTEIKFCVNWTN